MARKKLRDFYTNEAVEFCKRVLEDKPLLPFLVPVILGAWAVERWLVPFSNWIPLAVVVWAMIQYGRFQRQILLEELNQKWSRLILNTLPITPFEPCEWLNKLLMEVWPNFMEPKFSIRFRSIVEKRLKHRRPLLIERIELLEFSLGSCPPSLGLLHGTHWLTSGEQRVMRMGFDWDTTDMSILLHAKFTKPFGTARIVVNSIHIKGDLLFMPILDGQAILYSFESTPEVRIGVAFGSGGGQALPATELPGVSSWLVKLFNDTLRKTMVEPRRRCYPLPPLDLRKKAIGGVISVTVVSASKLVRNTIKGSNLERQQNSTGSSLEGSSGSRILHTLVEVELGDLTRRTDVSPGSSPRWETTFNMVLHENVGTLRFHLYEWAPSNVKYDYLTSCEVKFMYVADDSTIFWAIGTGSSVLAKHSENCGKVVDMVVPFEGTNVGELRLSLVLKEWQFSDASNSMNSSTSVSAQSSVYGSSNFMSRTGRKLKVSVVEGRDLAGKDRSGKSGPYVKLQYGKTLHRTKTIPHAVNPVWSQAFEFDEIGGSEYLKIKCYSADIFGLNIGSARINLEGLIEGSPRDIWIPLEKVNTGELRFRIEVVKIIDNVQSRNGMVGLGNGWIELVLIEAKDLIAADLRGTSDPYVRVQYGNIKKATKVVHKTLNPQWNQKLEFPDNGSQLVLHVKDHNAVLPALSIGDCVVEYERLPPNQMADKWIPLQGVKSGEIHIQITRKVPELEKKSSLDSDISAFSKAHQISSEVKQIITKFRGLVEDGDLEGLSLALSEMESIEGTQGEYTMQLEREKMQLLSKINELDREIRRSSASPIRKM